MKVFGMEVVEVDGQTTPFVVAPCADGSAWVCEIGGESVHISADRMRAIAAEIVEEFAAKRVKP